MGTLNLNFTFPDSDTKVSSLLYPYPSSVARRETLTYIGNFINEFYSGSISLTTGTQSRGGAFASGTATFSGQPTATDTLTINGVVFEFVAAGATGTQVDIGASLALTLAELVTVFDTAKATNAALINLTIAASATVATITSTVIGTPSNLIALAESSTVITLSAATLTGGTAATVTTF
jgi:hypothetical protein